MKVPRIDFEMDNVSQGGFEMTARKATSVSPHEAAENNIRFPTNRNNIITPQKPYWYLEI